MKNSQTHTEYFVFSDAYWAWLFRFFEIIYDALVMCVSLDVTGSLAEPTNSLAKFWRFFFLHNIITSFSVLSMIKRYFQGDNFEDTSNVDISDTTSTIGVTELNSGTVCVSTGTITSAALVPTSCIVCIL